MAEAKKPKVATAALARLSVCARQAGFRRAGRAWPAEAVIVEADEFTEAQIEQLLAEPMLVVKPVTEAEQ